MVAELQHCHDLPEKPEPNELFVQVHCRDTEPTGEIPISLASCDKRRISITSELQHINVDLHKTRK
jgi:hypothetical protein